MHQERITTLQNHLAADQGSLITDFYNIFYLTGFRGISPQEREAVAFFTKRKAYLFLPAMYGEQGKNLKTVKNGFVELDIDHERDGLLFCYQKKLNKGIRTVFFEDHNVKVRELEMLKKKAVIKVNWKPSPTPLAHKRAKKDAAEQLLLQKAAAITDAIWNKTVNFLQNTDYTKLKEFDVAHFMLQEARRLGAESEGFATIVASGPNSSRPHHVTSNRRLRHQEPLLIDCGFYYQGYTADLTRTIFLGSPDQEFRKIYTLVKNANHQSIKQCHAGSAVSELCGIANEIFFRAALLPHYLHGLGHGVGLEVHEPPFLRNQGTEQLEPGMIITIEPGLYFSGKFGIRIEDLILITDKEPRILSHNSTKELLFIE